MARAATRSPRQALAARRVARRATAPGRRRRAAGRPVCASRRRPAPEALERAGSSARGASVPASLLRAGARAVAGAPVGALAHVADAVDRNRGRVRDTRRLGKPRSGEDYLINASKSFTTSAGQADFYVLQTRTPGACATDISFFIVDGKAPGIKAQSSWEALGVHGNHSGPITYEMLPCPSTIVWAQRIKAGHYLSWRVAHLFDWPGRGLARRGPRGARWRMSQSWRQGHHSQRISTGQPHRPR